MEAIYVVEPHNDQYVITGFTERSTAHKYGVRHLTVLIAPFVTGGKSNGQLIIHDRAAKQWAKGLTGCESPEYNLFGGHCSVDNPADFSVMRRQVSIEKICRPAAEREMKEELLFRQVPNQKLKVNERQLEIWEDKRNTYKTLIGYEIELLGKDLLPIGFTSYTAKNNVEVSYFFALPVPHDMVELVIAADNYISEGEEHDVYLPIFLVTPQDLFAMPKSDVCDGISRLTLPENMDANNKLIKTIDNYVKAHGH